MRLARFFGLIIRLKTTFYSHAHMPIEPAFSLDLHGTPIPVVFSLSTARFPAADGAHEMEILSGPERWLFIFPPGEEAENSRGFFEVSFRALDGRPDPQAPASPENPERGFVANDGRRGLQLGANQIGELHYCVRFSQSTTPQQARDAAERRRQAAMLASGVRMILARDGQATREQLINQAREFANAVDAEAQIKAVILESEFSGLFAETPFPTRL